MANIIELTDASADHEVLTSTGSDGLFGGQYLQDRPLSTYLEEGEQPRYLLRNKKSGLELDGPSGSETIKPDEELQALALVTDVRLLVSVGQTQGDVTRSLPHADVVESSVEKSGFMETTLIVESLDGAVWKFPCRGDVEEVANYIDGVGQVWANATRLLDDVTGAITQAKEYIAEGEYADATAELSGSRDAIETARMRLRDVGDAAIGEIQGRATDLETELDSLTRQIAASRGASEHAAAQHAWTNSEYENAADAYNTAIDAYERALGTPGDTPGRKSLISRVSAAVRERELLRVGPRIDADATRRRAQSIDDPEEAAIVWTEALDRYRDMLGLHWPSSDDSFVVDRELIREQTTVVADDAIEDHFQAGEAWLHSGDELAVEGHEDKADRVYERAHEQFGRALALAREVRPERTQELEDRLATVENRLDGQYPDEAPAKEPLAVETVQSEGPETSTEESGEEGEQSVLNRISQDKQSGSGDSPPESEPGPQTPVPGPKQAESSESGPGRTDGKKEQSPVANESAADPDESDSDAEGDREESTTGTDSEGEGTGSSRASQSEENARSSNADPALSQETVVERLRALDEATFTELVANLWSAKGYTTTVFTATTKTVYDIVALGGDPEARILVWSNHRPDGSSIGSTVIKRCATARDSSEGADSAVLVTSGTVTETARNAADARDVTIVDCEQLAELLGANDIQIPDTDE